MECVQATSFRGWGFKKGAQHLLLWPESVKGLNGDVSSSAGAAGDDFFVDQLLNLNADNFQEENGIAGDGEHKETETHRRKDDGFDFLSPPQRTLTASEDGFHSLLTLPEEEPDLEWLSQFVEDSFSQFNHAAGATLPVKNQPEKQQKPSSFSPPAVHPRSRRSKRLRSAFPAANRLWTLAAQPAGSPSMSISLTESTTSSSPSSSATSSPYWATSPSTPLALPGPNKKKRGWARPSRESGSASSGRRCSHCGSQKTPQWRAGPMGAKTLCNACGVRFKSGRLLPEYRPACSPTFSKELHSNSHRKVLEMRRNKDGPGQPEPGFAPALPSFG